MRKIKFRARLADTGTWVYGDLTHTAKINTKEEAVESARHTHPVIRISNHDVDETTIGQFTGLDDKEGTEIYEGDLLKFTDEDGREHLRSVVFEAGAFCFKHSECSTCTPISGHAYWKYTVIGNIHDNPELLITETIGQWQ